MAWLNPHLFQALLTQGTVRCMVQAAFQTVFTEGMPAWRGHRLIKQPAFIRNRVLLNAHLFNRNNYSGCMLPTGRHVCVMIPHAKSTFKIIGIQQIFGDFFAGFLFGKLLYGAFGNT